MNPPLSRLIGSLPVILLAPKLPQIPNAPHLGSRPEFDFGEEILKANGYHSILFIRVARLILVPIALLGGYVVYLWARELYGVHAGIAALLLWCASPDILAHGHLMTPDMTSTSLGLLSSYRFYCWLKNPTVRNACLAGVTLGLALFSKSTWILLIPIFVLLYILFSVVKGPKTNVSARIPIAQLAFVFVLGIYVLNMGYGFEGSFRPLGSFEFLSPTFSGRFDNRSGNRFSASIVSFVPVPFPSDFIQGIDEQKEAVDRGVESYLRGEWKKGGWWYYYLYCLAIKLPVGVWLMMCLALPTVFLLNSPDRRAEIAILLPAAVIFITASLQTGVCYLRYILPVLPALFIWSSQMVASRFAVIRKLAAIACTWSVCSSLWIYPHSLSYFNEFVGGPFNGDQHLLDSNMDWGQDLFYCERLLQSGSFLRERPELIYYGSVHPADLGMRFNYPQFSPSQSRLSRGVYAVSVNFVQGKLKPVPADGRGRVQVERNTFNQFRDKVPISMAGYSIRIYRIAD